MPTVLRGKQEPRLLSTPSGGVYSQGLDVSALCKSAEFDLFDWQRYAVSAALVQDGAGQWVSREVAFLVARQNGKGGVLAALSLYGLFFDESVKEILFSAHEFKTAKKAYRELREIIKGAPHLLAQVERRGSRVVGFRNSNEDTSITLADGDKVTCVIRYLARSHNTGRGFSPQMLIIDEAQECSEETRQALAYTVRAQPNPLIAWCGTVPHPTRNNSEAFTALRDRGRSGVDASLTWMEWSPDPALDVDALRVDVELFDSVALECNPAVGYRVDLETIRSERDAARTDEAWAGFLREALSWWPEAGGAAGWSVVPEAVWLEACVESALLDPVVLGVEVSPSFDRACVVAAGDTGDGEGFELIDDRPGTEWLVDLVARIHKDSGSRGVVIDQRSPAASFVEAFEAAGVPVLSPKSSEWVTACGSWFVGVGSGAVTCWPAAVMDEAVAVMAKRAAGDAWVIDRRGSEWVGPVCGAVGALWGHRRPVVEDVAVSAYESRGFESVR